MLILTLFFPFISSFVCGIFGRYFGHKGVSILATFFLFLSVLVSWYSFYYIGLGGQISNLIVFSWIATENFNVSFGFLYDSLTVIMLVVVCFISFIVHLYSIDYMADDPHLPRFLSYLSLFTFFMIILVTANNLLQMFIGWEGVGLCSYLLINFWYTRIQANKAAIKAMIINRIGDFFLAFAIFLSIYIFNTLDYVTIFSLIPFYLDTFFFLFSYKIYIVDIFSFFLFLGAIGKSAQIGLHTWLPDAMEGPTPVSALIHAATMVTAGVFLVARCSPIFEYSPFVLTIMTCFGCLTAFFAATTGLLQNDLKKVIAYSTCSQLGYMFFACGLSNYAIAIFHLANHAFFKALLFLGAGSIIHAVSDEQDMRKMGGLKLLLPFTYAMMLIGSLALMGFPFLAGFYSKDIILETSYSNFSVISHYSYWLGLAAAFCTAFYSTRLLCLAFLVKPNGKKILIENAHESNWKIWFSLAALAIPSIFVGFFFKDLFVGFGTSFWQFSIFTHPLFYKNFDGEFLPILVKILPLIVSILGGVLAYLLYTFFSKGLYLVKISLSGRYFFTFLNRKWYLDRLYNELLAQQVLKTGFLFSYVLIDRGVIEYFGPQGLIKKISQIYSNFIFLQSGLLYHYTFILFCGVVFFCLFLPLFYLSFTKIIFFLLFIYCVKKI